MLEFHILDRSVIEVKGADAKDFLQGLITQDIKNVENVAGYSMILTATGRYLFDFFIIPINDYYIIDISSNRADELVSFLLKYKLRRNIEIIKTDLIVGWSKSNAEGDLGAITKNSSGSITIYKDPRLKELGIRIIATSQTAIEAFGYKEVKGFDIYRQLRFQLGVAESGDFWLERAIPIEWGVDDLHAISYTKGCYLGQELTHRMKHQGEPRYKLLPFTSDSEILTGEVLEKEGKEVINIVASTGSFGLALVRLDLKVGETEFNGKKINIYVPNI